MKPTDVKKPLRVLVVGMTSTVGGVENFLMAYCGRMDQERVRFDFLSRYADAAFPEKREEIGHTYVIPRRSEDPVKYYREIRAFFEEHAKEYDVIWDNECMFSDMTPLKLAAEYGIPVRIAHSHNPQNTDPSLKGKLRGLLHRAQRRSLARYANVLWACSEESARWVCPAMDLPFAIVPHAIDAAEYRFNAVTRAEVRQHYGLTDCLVVGHVGRLHYQKNQTFLLEAFARLHQREERARLVLVGDGPNLLALEAKAVELGVEKEVLFLGQRDDVPRLLQAFDLFVMPSRFEGLGMAAVEAQASGLPCLLSDAVSRGAAITRDVEFLPAEDADVWAEHMLDTLESLPERVRPDTQAAITRAGHELAEAAERLTCRFEQLVQDKPSFKRMFLLTTYPAGRLDVMADKARRDMQQIAADAGYALLNPDIPQKADKWWQVPLQYVRVLWEGCKLFWKLRHGDLLAVQYPFHPVRTAGVLRCALHMIQWKGAKTAACIHDLEVLRQPGSGAARWSDRELLMCFDQLIVPNARMADYLIGQGAAEDKVINLQVMDRLGEEPVPERPLAPAVCVVGDLTRKRSRYLHEIPRSKLTWHLHGEGWKGKAKRTDMIYHGGKMTRLEGSFGLIWEGQSTRVCTGAQGAYMMLSTPRKMSLYLTQGMPVIVWKWSAMAAFVRENGLGLVIDTIADIPGAVTALTDAEYACMAANARAWGEKLCRGDMTRDALRQLRG
ncbi:MAG: glycosyltransferase [Clostridia bacterium]|nr:glycosyltransferase [Clostridia bacterium]